MDITLVEKIKELTIISLASDDKLMESIVLKGGNAIELLFSKKEISRTSYDLDYAIVDGDFKNSEEISDRIKSTLKKTFLEKEWIILDYRFTEKPKNPTKLSDFWGGYLVEFKVIKREKYFKINDLEKSIRSATSLRPNNSTNFKIEISKFEFTSGKKEVNLDGYKLYVYSPVMIVLEKVRAICQQLPQYKDIVPSFTQRARARDFYDIYLIMQLHTFDPSSKENLNLLRTIFSCKKVPLPYLKEIEKNKNLHKDNWESVKATVFAKDELKDFDFYFDYVVKTFGNLKVL